MPRDRGATPVAAPQVRWEPVVHQERSTPTLPSAVDGRDPLRKDLADKRTLGTNPATPTSFGAGRDPVSTRTDPQFRGEPVVRQQGSTTTLPAPVDGLDPLRRGLADAKAPGTIPAAPASIGDNRDARLQYGAIGAREPLPTTGREPEKLTLLNGVVRTVKVEDGILKELRPDGKGGTSWVDASTAYDAPNPNYPSMIERRPGLVRYFYANGHLYNSAGTDLGKFGINNNASDSLVGKQFLDTWGSLEQRQPGHRTPTLIDFNASPAQFGSQHAVIELGPPPGLVAVHVESKKGVLVDVPGRNEFSFVENDRGFEKLWVKPEDVANHRGAPQYTKKEVLALPKTSDGYRYTADGTTRFEVNSDGLITTQRKVHHTTNWRDQRNELCNATVNWVSDPRAVKAIPPVTGPNPGPAPGPLPGPNSDGPPIGNGKQDRGGSAPIQPISPPRIVAPPPVAAPVFPPVLPPTIPPVPPAAPVPNSDSPVPFVGGAKGPGPSGAPAPETKPGEPAARPPTLDQLRAMLPTMPKLDLEPTRRVIVQLGKDLGAILTEVQPKLEQLRQALATPKLTAPTAVDGNSGKRTNEPAPPAQIIPPPREIPVAPPIPPPVVAPPQPVAKVEVIPQMPLRNLSAPDADAILMLYSGVRRTDELAGDMKRSLEAGHPPDFSTRVTFGENWFPQPMQAGKRYDDIINDLRIYNTRTTGETSVDTSNAFTTGTDRMATFITPIKGLLERQMAGMPGAMQQVQGAHTAMRGNFTALVQQHGGPDSVLANIRANAARRYPDDYAAWTTHKKKLDEGQNPDPVTFSSPEAAYHFRLITSLEKDLKKPLAAAAPK